MTTFNDALKDAHDASEEAARVRQDSLPAAQKACRALETALKAALNGEPLRGLKNVGTNGVALYAARVRATSPHQKIPHPSAAGSAGDFLVINQNGELALVCWDSDNSDDLIETLAQDSDLRIDDVTAMTKILRQEILPAHVKAAKATNKRYHQAYALALKVITVLAEDGD